MAAISPEVFGFLKSLKIITANGLQKIKNFTQSLSKM
jgi:hypothetical protein